MFANLSIIDEEQAIMGKYVEFYCLKFRYNLFPFKHAAHGNRNHLKSILKKELDNKLTHLNESNCSA